MKKNVLLVTTCFVLLIGGGFGWMALNKVSTQSKVEGQAPDSSTKAQNSEGKVKEELSSTDLQTVSKHIDRLNVELLDLNHRIRMLGFPEAFRNPRLTEGERAHLVQLLNLQSDLEIKLHRLKLEKFDLEMEATL